MDEWIGKLELRIADIHTALCVQHLKQQMANADEVPQYASRIAQIRQRKQVMSNMLKVVQNTFRHAWLGVAPNAALRVESAHLSKTRNVTNNANNKGNQHGHHTSYHSRSGADRRVTYMAAQP
jgi:hypothetical protein